MRQLYIDILVDLQEIGCSRICNQLLRFLYVSTNVVSNLFSMIVIIYYCEQNHLSAASILTI